MDIELNDELDGLDLSVLSKGGEISSTPGLNMGSEIESIEAISGPPAEEKPKVVVAEEPIIPAEEEEKEEEEVEEQEEEDDEEEPAKPQKYTPKPSIGPKDKPSPLKIWAEMNREKGIIEYSDDEFEDSEDFLLNKVKEKISKEVEASIEEYKNSFTPEAKEIIEAIEAGIPLESVLQHNMTIQSYENIKDSEIEENDSLQKTLVRNLYAAKGYSKDVIEKKISRFDDTGILADEAKEARLELVELAKIQKAEEQKQKNIEKKQQIDRYESWKKSTKDFLDKNDEIIPGFKMDSKQKETIFKGLTVFDKDGKNEFQKAIDQDPNFNLKVAYLALALKWDFSKFDQKAATKVVKGLKDALRDQDKMKNGFGGGDHGIKSSTNISVIQKALKSSKD